MTAGQGLPSLPQRPFCRMQRVRNTNSACHGTGCLRTRSCTRPGSVVLGSIDWGGWVAGLPQIHGPQGLLSLAAKTAFILTNMQLVVIGAI